MKKLLTLSIVALLLISLLPVSNAATERDGVSGFVVGCCFGIRTGGQFNEGKDLHFRDWGRLIPFVNIALALWDGIDGAQGITSDDLAQQYGESYF
jgi:hypothetical protein